MATSRSGFAVDRPAHTWAPRQDEHGAEDRNRGSPPHERAERCVAAHYRRGPPAHVSAVRPASLRRGRGVDTRAWRGTAAATRARGSRQGGGEAGGGLSSLPLQSVYGRADGAAGVRAGPQALLGSGHGAGADALEPVRLERGPGTRRGGWTVATGGKAPRMADAGALGPAGGGWEAVGLAYVAGQGCTQAGGRTCRPGLVRLGTALGTGSRVAPPGVRRGLPCELMGTQAPAAAPNRPPGWG